MIKELRIKFNSKCLYKSNRKLPFSYFRFEGYRSLRLGRLVIEVFSRRKTNVKK